MEQVNSVIEIMNKLQGIEYGWCDIDKNVYRNIEKGYKKKYVLANPLDVIETKVGTCYDLVELERAYFEELNKKCMTFFMVYYEAKKLHTHTFLVYEENEKFYWLEWAWEVNKGIHEYMSLFDLLTDVREKFQDFYNLKFIDLDYLCIYKYSKPKVNIGLKEFYKHCENGENIII